MIPGVIVIVEKLDKSKNPVLEPSEWESWKPGGKNVHSLPINYQMGGVLLEPVEAGGRILLLRTWRNGVTSLGLFTSSPIMQVNGNLVETFNSIYRITEI